MTDKFRNAGGGLGKAGGLYQLKKSGSGGTWVAQLVKTFSLGSGHDLRAQRERLSQRERFSLSHTPLLMSSKINLKKQKKNLDLTH